MNAEQDPFVSMTGEKLRALIKASGFSQAEVSRRLEVATGTMSNWCKGATSPDLKNAHAIARFFGVSLEYLADDSLDEPPATGEAWESEIMNMVRDLGPALARRRLLGLPDDARPPSGSVVEAGRPLQQRDETALQLRLEREQREQRGGPTAGVPIPAKPVDKG